MISEGNKKLIDEYIGNNPDCKLNQSRIETIHGDQVEVHGYRLPTKLVFFNINNGRFQTHYINLVKKYGGDMDSQKPADAEKIKNLLLTLDSKDGGLSIDSKRTMNDIKKKGQLELGIITQDGFLIDGNRRMAVLQKLFDDEHDSKYEYINVARIEQSILDKEMYAIEASVSLGMDPKVRYGPLNELLKLDQGLKIGYNASEIANLLYGDIPEDEIKTKISRLNLIQDYLKHFFKDAENLLLAEGKNEHFIELQKILDLAKDKSITEKTKIRYAAFNLIYSGVSSDRLRIIKFALNEEYDITTLLKIADITNVSEQKENDDDDDLEDEKTESEVLFLNLEDEVKAQKNSKSPSIILTHILNNFKALDYDQLDSTDSDVTFLISSVLEHMKKLEMKL